MAHLHEVKDSDTHFIINPVTMAISNAQNEKNKLQQGDHNSEIFTFQIPKEVEGHDMSLCDVVRVHYINTSTSKADISKDIHKVVDMAVAEDDAETLVFTWLIHGNATKYNGSLAFRILFACTDENDNYTYKKWTEIYKGISIGEGFENEETVLEAQADILKQEFDELEKQMEELTKELENDFSQLSEEIGDLEATVNDLKENGVSSSGSGLNKTAKTLLITLLKATPYATDQRANIEALEVALGQGDSSSGGEDEETTTYTIINVLTNVSNNNSDESVNANSSYNATLTPISGNISSVVITMGGVDITESVYSNGVITIPSVTGDIIITATSGEYVTTPVISDYVDVKKIKKGETVEFNGTLGGDNCLVLIPLTPIETEQMNYLKFDNDYYLRPYMYNGIAITMIQTNYTLGLQNVTVDKISGMTIGKVDDSYGGTYYNYDSKSLTFTGYGTNYLKTNTYPITYFNNKIETDWVCISYSRALTSDEVLQLFAQYVE